MPPAKGKILAAAIAASGAMTAAGEAATANDLEKRGRVLAVRLCAQCHAVGKTDASHRAGALPLRNLEQRINLDTFASRLRQGQMSGHQDMREFRFSRDDARALAAYLRSIQAP